eukprot:3070-Heterococcus_DN1.PRE.6
MAHAFTMTAALVIIIWNLVDLGDKQDGTDPHDMKLNQKVLETNSFWVLIVLFCVAFSRGESLWTVLVIYGEATRVFRSMPVVSGSRDWHRDEQNAVENGQNVQNVQYVWSYKERSNEAGGWVNMSRPVGLRLQKSQHSATISNEPRSWFNTLKSRFNDFRSWCDDRMNWFMFQACRRHTEMAAQNPHLAYGNCLPYDVDVDAFTRIMRRGVFRRLREF